MPQGTSNYMAGKRWTDFGTSDDLNLDATGDESTIYYWPYPVYVTRVMIMATPGSVIQNTTGDVTVHVHKDADSDGAEDTAIGSFDIGTGAFSYDTDEPIVATMLFADTDGETAEDGATRYVAPVGPVFVDVGEGFLLKMDGTDVCDGASVGRLAVEYVELPDGNTAQTYVEVNAT